MHENCASRDVSLRFISTLERNFGVKRYAMVTCWSSGVEVVVGVVVVGVL